MAAMKREKQYDMFDVATSACDLDDYLNQRYSENDLQSKFWIEKNDEMDELRPPPPGAETNEPVLIPIQGPRAEKARPTPPEPTPPEPTPPERTPSERPALESATERPASSASSAPSEREAAQLQSEVAPAPVAGPSQTREAPALETRQSEVPTAPSMETFQQSREEESAPTAEPPILEQPTSEKKAPSMEELLAQFHQATKAYQERAGEEQPPEAPPGS